MAAAYALQPFKQMQNGILGFDVLSCSINTKNGLNEGIFVRQPCKRRSI
jgi:hypothetical protein